MAATFSDRVLIGCTKGLLVCHTPAAYFACGVAAATVWQRKVWKGLGSKPIQPKIGKPSEEVRRSHSFSGPGVCLGFATPQTVFGRQSLPSDGSAVRSADPTLQP